MYIQQYVRVDQTAERDNASQQTRASVLSRTTMYVQFFLCLPSLLCIEKCVIKPPTTTTAIVRALSLHDLSRRLLISRTDTSQ